MSAGRVLVADDEQEIRKIIKVYLEAGNYEIDEAEDGRETLKLFDEKQYDVVVVDIMMPEINGWEVCRKIREKSDVALIILSAKGEEYDKLKGFELEVDDYMVKPFSPKELLARIKTILRRKEAAKKTDDGSRFTYKTLEVDFDANNVFIDGEKIRLAPREYELLEYFIRNQNLVLSRNQLLDGVWGMDFFGDDRTVDSHVKSLRENLGEYRDLIVTVWGKGYKFEKSDKL